MAKMNEALLREIAEQIAKEQIFVNLWIYALMLVVSLIGSFGFAYLGAYAKRRGETFATKADFDELLKQLKATTEVAEDVKAKITHADWATRELKTLKRLKLEELIRMVHETEGWLEECRNHYIFADNQKPAASPQANVESLTNLYFPELKTIIGKYIDESRQAYIKILEVRKEILEVTNNPDAQNRCRQKFVKNVGEDWKNRAGHIKNLESDARNIMAELIGSLDLQNL
jgi:hypothetical protein